ncbi:MAG: peptidyl-tRNA hydrolase [Corynebacterium sp.]|nr:peptidyl-tRNA hydrolase [Corynebacterium sp.]
MTVMSSHPSEKFSQAWERLAVATSSRSWREDVEDPARPETVQAMQIVLNLPKAAPPARHVALSAAARAVVAVCLDDRAAGDTAFAAGLARWYGHRIRKVARRARNKAWQDVQTLPGRTADDIARAFVPSAVANVEPLIAKLQIGHTDLPADAPAALPSLDPARLQRPAIFVDSSLKMTLGKAAAQVGHGSMLLAGFVTCAEAWNWAQDDFSLDVREIRHAEFAALAQDIAAGSKRGVVIRDAGFTEVAPDSATVVAIWPQ